MNVRNVRMVQSREDFRFALKSDDTLDVTDNGRRQNLDGDLAIEDGIGGAIHLAHAAHTEQRGDFKWAEARAWRQSQGIGGIIRAAAVKNVD
jgi:hypothetical protein